MKTFIETFQFIFGVDAGIISFIFRNFYWERATLRVLRAETWLTVYRTIAIPKP